MRRNRRRTNWDRVILVTLLVIGGVWALNEHADKIPGMSKWVSVRELHDDFDSYVGKNVTVSGQIFLSMGTADVGVLEGIRDSGGYIVYFKPRGERVFRIGDNYVVQGVATRGKYCTACETYYVKEN